MPSRFLPVVVVVAVLAVAVVAVVVIAAVVVVPVVVLGVDDDGVSTLGVETVPSSVFSDMLASRNLSMLAPIACCRASFPIPLNDNDNDNGRQRLAQSPPRRVETTTAFDKKKKR